ncbi:MAG: DUF2635 domain-containing protein [Alphaproteobacteria bacterium]|nr:DUF2635 domain-containing protein [Alphaproteobacteria bacterium]MDD9919778.1 DUF2635 domain-containing protein [Alphaproteobacteria bacterium]
MTLFVRPARKKLKVRNPETGQHLPAEGMHVTQSTYWLRRIKDGDVLTTQVKESTNKKAKS